MLMDKAGIWCQIGGGIWSPNPRRLNGVSVLTPLGRRGHTSGATSEVLRAMYFTLPRNMNWHMPIRQREEHGRQSIPGERNGLSHKGYG